MTPLVLITGFLGAGKTSLLRRLLPLVKEAGLRPHVILNDYANAEVDSATLRALVDDITPITGSCVCCGSLDELLMSLEDIPLGERDVVLVETNGTTDPLPLIETLLLVPAGQRFGALSQVHLVDCQRWQTRRYSNELERKQTRTASHGIYAWRDRVGDAREAEVRTAVRRLNPRIRETDPEALAQELATLAATPDGQLPRTFVSVFDPEVDERFRVATIFDNPAGRPPKAKSSTFDLARNGLQPRAAHDPSHALAHRYTALQLELPRRVRPLALIAWLENLPPNVIRAKGIVEFADTPGKFQFFQRVEDTVAFEELPCDPPEGLTLALLIGIELDEVELRKDLAVLTDSQLKAQQTPTKSSRRRAFKT